MYENGKKHGECRYYIKSGQLEFIFNYKDGRKHGEIREFHSNGQLLSVEYFEDGYGVNMNSWKYYDENGIEQN